MESVPLFTQNVQFLEDREKYWYSRYTNQTVSEVPAMVYPAGSWYPPQSPSPSPPPPPPLLPLHTFPKFAYDPAIDGSETTWNVDDEVKVMANVQAYFEVAQKVGISFACFQDVVTLYPAYSRLCPAYH